VAQPEVVGAAPLNVNIGSAVGNADASGCEGLTSVLKRRHDWRRYHGVDGTSRRVGFVVIADNLINIAVFATARATA
jgi:hypothetical protein